jgi:peptidoglycan/LPS O-acetylase OafA/YrhL
MSHLKYRPEIDGLRAVAVIPVILFHFSEAFLPGGYLGVDVFFVISGFLITSLIIKDHELGRFSMVNFWMRRIRRIMPALLALLLSILLLSPFLTEVMHLGKQVLYTLLSVSNFYFWSNTGNYWGTDSATSPLLNMWSLSVEEQFYFFYPLILVFLLKRYHRAAAILVAIGSLISLGLFLYAAPIHPTATFYALPTRAGEMGAGGFLALMLFRHRSLLRMPQLLQQVFSGLGLVLIFVSFFAVQGEGVVTWDALWAVVGSVLLIGFSSGEGNLCRKLLSLPAIVYVGKISYSLYLWHWPVMVCYRSRLFLHSETTIILASLATFIPAAVLSYHFVEQPFRKHKKIVHWVLPAYVCAAVVSVCLLSGWLSFAVKDSYAPTIWHREYDMTSRAPYGTTRNPRKDLTHPPVQWEEDVSSDAVGIGNHRRDGDALDVFVIGDSHGVALARMLHDVCVDTGATYKISVADSTDPFYQLPVQMEGGTSLMDADEVYAYNNAKLDFIREERPALVVIVTRWSFRISEQSLVEVQDLLELLETVGSRVLFIEQAPEMGFGKRSAPPVLSFIGMHPKEGERQYLRMGNLEGYEAGQAVMRKLCEQNAHCEFVSIEDLYRRGDEALILEGAKILYIDDNHLSYEGTKLMQLRIQGKILDMLRAKSLPSEE